MNLTIKEQVELFKSLFKGREDIFAIWWENGKKNGYMRAYDYDPYMYRLHKMRGGSFQSYTDKTHKALTDNEITKHLKGE